MHRASEFRLSANHPCLGQGVTRQSQVKGGMRAWEGCYNATIISPAGLKNGILRTRVTQGEPISGTLWPWSRERSRVPVRVRTVLPTDGTKGSAAVRMCSLAKPFWDVTCAVRL